MQGHPEKDNYALDTAVYVSSHKLMYAHLGNIPLGCRYCLKTIQDSLTVFKNSQVLCFTAECRDHTYITMIPYYISYIIVID